MYLFVMLQHLALEKKIKLCFVCAFTFIIIYIIKMWIWVVKMANLTQGVCFCANLQAGRGVHQRLQVHT